MKHADPRFIDAFEHSYVTADYLPGGEHVEAAAAWWWLSFSDPDRPEGQRSLGACMVKAAGASLALSAATMTGLNPGGAVRITGPLADADVPAEQPCWALLSRAEVEAADTAIEAAEGRTDDN